MKPRLDGDVSFMKDLSLVFRFFLFHRLTNLIEWAGHTSLQVWQRVHRVVFVVKSDLIAS